MYGLYSVKLLFESNYHPDSIAERVLEERIVIVRAKHFTEIESLIKKKFPPDRYKNAEGGITTSTLVGILDIFELVDNIEKSLEFAEVYSRHLLVDKDIRTDEAIKLYSLNA
ncbi:DUF4288 domain-containing protein [Sporosarcina sp. PTS2304]|uniref:DUF4288 domain-containing protein n=1 Tax=Sporosarcina sp. PTS2304 TaxID=2283194 RepID=UPI0013B3F353|nr:DUF4288 domain-containing protein [Sporosarcina sp. PTS2304]